MATRTVNAPRPITRRVRRVLLATALVCLAIAAPASALSVTASLSTSSPIAGQPVTCLPAIVGPVPGEVVSFTWGEWGTRTFGNSNTNTITLSPDSGGKYIFCQVTVTPPLPLQPVTTGFIDRVQGIAPSDKSAPSITGTAKAGRTVTCRHGRWTALPTSFSRTWLRDGSPVGDGARTRKLTRADSGHAIACRIVAHNDFGSSPAVTSPSVTAH